MKEKTLKIFMMDGTTEFIQVPEWKTTANIINRLNKDFGTKWSNWETLEP